MAERLLTILFAATVALSSGCAADAPSVDTLPPARKARIPFTDYQIAGAHLFLRRDLGDAQCMDCESRSYVDGESLLGEPLTTTKLFLLAGRLEPDEMARRAMDILLSRVGESWLSKPGRENGCVQEEDVCARIGPPKIEGDTLTLWINEGTTNPTLTRVEVDLTSAEVTRTPWQDLPPK